MSSSSSTNCQGFLEELDTEFFCDLQIARDIVKSLKRPKGLTQAIDKTINGCHEATFVDREIASRLIARVMALNSDSLEVKDNRNQFTKYFVKVLRKTNETQPPQYDQWFKPRESKQPEEASFWSPDHRTYVATKTIPGFGMLVYLAVSYEPQLGWQENGFLTYKF